MIEKEMATLLVDPLRIAHGEDFGRIREVRRDPLVVLPESVMREREDSNSGRAASVGRARRARRLGMATRPA